MAPRWADTPSPGGPGWPTRRRPRPLRGGGGVAVAAAVAGGGAATVGRDSRAGGVAEKATAAGHVHDAGESGSGGRGSSSRNGDGADVTRVGGKGSGGRGSPSRRGGVTEHRSRFGGSVALSTNGDIIGGGSDNGLAPARGKQRATLVLLTFLWLSCSVMSAHCPRRPDKYATNGPWWSAARGARAGGKNSSTSKVATKAGPVRRTTKSPGQGAASAGMVTATGPRKATGSPPSNSRASSLTVRACW